MDAQQFLAEFGHIANAPGGVGKLRELILELAIRGELLTASVGATNDRRSVSTFPQQPANSGTNWTWISKQTGQ